LNALKGHSTLPFGVLCFFDELFYYILVMKMVSSVFLTTCFLIALVFVFSCSSDGDNGLYNSSSSVYKNSSSDGDSSSSYTKLSSSSVTLSSSSNKPLSSSSIVSYSSSTLCANFVEGTEREHYGRKKKQFCDARDGKKYVYVTIGEVETAQVWMAENLNFNAMGSKCGYPAPSVGTLVDSGGLCSTYGRLYDWATAMVFDSSCNSNICSSQVQSKHKGVCPDGWHIPSNEEWTILTNFVSTDGEGANAGAILKANSDLWQSYSNGTDDYGFSALPGGIGMDSSYDRRGSCALWWSASDYLAGYAWSRYIDSHYSNVSKYDSDVKSYLFSVRCVKN
jgi:uncharacterized protein (TIGR02145 family)